MNVNFTKAMLAHGVTRIQHYEADENLPHDWFAVQLDYDSRLIGTGTSVAAAFYAAQQAREKLARKAA